MNTKAFESLTVLKYGAALLFILWFGISAPTVIYAVCLMLFLNELALWHIAPVGSIAKPFAFIGVGTSLALIYRQVEYMTANEKIGENFTLVMNFTLIIALLSGLVFTMRRISDVFRTEGCEPTEQDKIYLVIKRPKTMLDYLTCIFGSPVSSISFCINNDWLRFTSKDGCAVACDMSKAKGYAFIDTGITASKERLESFKKMKGKDWSMRNNCVTSWYNVTHGTILEPKPWEWLPSVYVTRVLRGLKK